MTTLEAENARLRAQVQELEAKLRIIDDIRDEAVGEVLGLRAALQTAEQESLCQTCIARGILPSKAIACYVHSIGLHDDLEALLQTAEQDAVANAAMLARQCDLARAAEQERDRERERTDVVIAEFDLPWPHSHTVGEVVSRSLAWQIHQARAAVEEARIEAETKVSALLAARDRLVEQIRALPSYVESDVALRPSMTEYVDAESLYEVARLLGIAGMSLTSQEGPCGEIVGLSEGEPAIAVSTLQRVTIEPIAAWCASELPVAGTGR